MHFLSQTTTMHNAAFIMAAATTNTPILATNVGGVSTLAQLISDFGIQIVLCSIMLIFMWRMMTNVLKRDNQIFDLIAPKYDELSKKFTDIGTVVSNLVSSHNAHANNEFHAMEKDLDDIRALLLANQDQLRDVAGNLTALSNSVDVLFRVLVNKSYGMILPQGLDYIPPRQEVQDVREIHSAEEMTEIEYKK